MADPRLSPTTWHLVASTAAVAEPGTDSPARSRGVSEGAQADGSVEPAGEANEPTASLPTARPGLIMLGMESAPTCTDGVCQ